MPTYGYLLPTRGSVLASDDDAALAAATRADVLGLAERAEALGFRSVWVGDSVLARPRHEPLTTLAAVGAVTDAVELGTAIYLPALRSPVSVAHMAATVDQVSGGRLALGVGVGSDEPGVRAEYANLGVPFADRGARLNELLAVATDLWAGDRVDHAGEHYRIEDASLGFGPVGEVPIHVATGGYRPGRGLPDSARERLVNHADGCLPNRLTPAEYAEMLAYARDRLADAGRDPDALEAGYYIDAVIAEDEATAFAEARAFYDRYYDDREPIADEALDRRGAFGPPSAVRETLASYADAGAERLVVRFPTRNQRANLRRFADLI
ncbi:MAG: LLM class flavin-dependent oxidoreductase [Haloferacaceae archaeon]